MSTQRGGHMLADTINARLDEVSGICAAVIHDVRTQETIFRNENTVFPAASLIKLFILFEFFRQIEAGKRDGNDRVLIQESQKVSGFGILKELGSGLSVSYFDLATLMIVLSDNTATNILIDTLGMDRINAAIADLGCSHTSLQRKMMDAEAKQRGLDNATSPKDVFSLLKCLETGSLLSAGSRKKYIDILKKQQCNNKLPLLLPEGTVMAHKTGDLPGTEHDAGILYLANGPVIIVVMTKNLADNLDGVHCNNIIGKLVYDHFTTC